MKDHLEQIFTRTSIKPTTRTKIGTNEVFIADGFVDAAQFPVLQRVFPGALREGQIERDQFPNGCYATLWITPGKIASRGGIRVTSPDNDQLSVRVKNIIDDATEELTRKVD